MKTQRLLTWAEIQYVYDQIHNKTSNNFDGESFLIQFTDCHDGSNYIFKNNFGGGMTVTQVMERLPGGRWVVSTGDNHDRRCVSAKEQESLEKRYQAFVKKHGENHCGGNHDETKTEYQIVIVTLPNGMRILCVHFDLEAHPRWKKKRAEPIKKGAPLWKRLLWMPAVKLADKIDSDKLDESFLIKITDLAKVYRCDGVLGGHYHPDKIIRQIYRKIQVVVGPQGINLIGFKPLQ